MCFFEATVNQKNWEIENSVVSGWADSWVILVQWRPRNLVILGAVLSHSLRNKEKLHG